MRKKDRRKLDAIVSTAATDIINTHANIVANAIEQTFKEDYGFGEKRMLKLMQQLNSRLPENMRFVPGEIKARRSA